MPIATPHAKPSTPPSNLLDRTQLISLAEAANLVRKWSGEKTNPSTIFRWCRDGRHGIRLPSVRLGRALRTSEAALVWWTEAISDAEGLSTAGVSALRPNNPNDLAAELAAEGL
ncbi:MAG: DUF1580 domain-containing protein [Planctomycetota bacterium]